jgi:3-dehydroquinate synthetase
MQAGFYSNETKKWNWGVTNESELIIKVYDNDIYIDDKAETHIKTYKSLGKKTGYDEDGDEYVLYSWMATDEKNKKCKFSMILYRELGLIIYSVIYSDLGFRYYVRKDNLDKLIDL